jgi:hypothetical protein
MAFTFAKCCRWKYVSTTYYFASSQNFDQRIHIEFVLGCLQVEAWPGVEHVHVVKSILLQIISVDSERIG